MNSSIELKHLDFRYNENSPAILKGISLVIPQRQSVGVVGRTGAGKSTNVDLLLNLYPPPKDKVFIGGQPIESIPLNQLRQQINCVQQDLFLFKGTVLENLTLGSAEIPVERVERVSSEIGLTFYLAKTNRSLSYIVEESEANLRTGEKQLISFARILIFDPEIEDGSPQK